MPPTYKQLYFHLFSAVSRSYDALEMGDILTARKVLIDAMQTAEKAHLEQDFLRDQ